MRESIRELVKICAATLPISEPIYEFGSFQVEGQELIANLRPVFPNKKYIGADMRPGPGVDVILNLHRINLPSESAGTILILDTLQHVEFPWLALEESYRILKPNGLLIVTSVMNWTIHGYPSDYWRFTPQAFRTLLRPFNFTFVEFAGNSKFPHTIIGLASKNKIPEKSFEEFKKKFCQWKKYWTNPPPKSWREWLLLFIPPIIIKVLKKIKI